MPNVLEQAMDHVQAVATGDSASRLAARREVRKEKAAAEIARKKYLALQDRLRLLNAEADTAADAHREVCEPTQAELAEVEERITNLMADRTEVPAELEAKRRELIDRIEVANEQLSDQVARFDRLRAPLNKAIRENSKGTAGVDVADNKLCSEEMADPALWREHFAQGEIGKALHSLARAAQAKIKEAKDWAEMARQTGKHGDPQTYIDRIPKWQAVLNAVEPIKREADRNADRLRQQMIDE